MSALVLTVIVVAVMSTIIYMISSSEVISKNLFEAKDEVIDEPWEG